MMIPPAIAIGLGIGLSFLGTLAAPANPTAWDLADPIADPDHDGVPNLLEYAFNLDPDNSSDAALAHTQLDTSGEHLTLTCRRRQQDPSLQYLPQVSLNLLDWLDNTTQPAEAPVTEELSAIPLDAEPSMELVTVRSLLPIAQTPRQFMRLKVQITPAPPLRPLEFSEAGNGGVLNQRYTFQVVLHAGGQVEFFV